MKNKLINDSVSSVPIQALPNAENTTGLRSEIAQEIISRQPDLIERKGLLIFLGILLVLVASTWFIQYPDIIKATATLTATNAPKEITSLQDGRLVNLFVRNGDEVHAKQILAWIESAGKHTEIIALSAQLDSSIRELANGRINMVVHLLNKRYYNLGELQPPYQLFIKATQQWRDGLPHGFQQQKKQYLQQDISSLEQLLTTVQQQKVIASKDVGLAQESFNMKSQLFHEKVISEEDYRTEQSKYANKQLSIPLLQANELSNIMQKRDKHKEILQLEHNINEQQLIFEQALHTLKNEVDEWKRKYLIQAPVDGKVVFIAPLQEQQILKPGKVLGYINPTTSNYFAELYLPQANFGKIDTGLRVQLRFDAYPYQEFGFVEGKLDYISSIAVDSGFVASVRLSNELVTSYHKTIQYNNGLKAEAIVITRDMKLLERLYYNLRKSTDQLSR